MNTPHPLAKVSPMIPALLLIVPGAFMIADGILIMLGNVPVFFSDVNYKFEFIMGYALIILGASQLSPKTH